MLEPPDFLRCLRLDDHFGTKRWLAELHVFWRLKEGGAYECEQHTLQIPLESNLERLIDPGDSSWGLRSFASRVDGLFGLDRLRRLREHELVPGVMAAIRAGHLVVIRQTGAASVDPAVKARADARRISCEIDRLSPGRLICDGRGYSIHAAGCFDRGEIGMTRQIVPPREAPKVLERLLQQYANQPPLAALLQEARPLLSPPMLGRDQEPDLVLLRHLRAPGQQVRSNEPAMTPSQIRAALTATLDITLVDREGTPQEGVVFEIKAPDGSMVKGKLDNKGQASAKSIGPGLFQVTFPELDGADWDGDGTQEVQEETRTELRRHNVVQGERMATIARAYGFANWRTLWDLPENAELKRRRKNPDVLLPGDQVVIPTKLARQAEMPGGSAKYVLRSETETLRVRFADADFDGEEDVRFKATPDRGTSVQGTLQKDCTMEIALPFGTTRLTVDLFHRESNDPFASYELALGHMDPLDEVSGIQARLVNLGYFNGPVDGEMNEATRQAIARFRFVELGERSDAVDPALIDSLMRAHRV